ncbi:endopeptidase La, partial [bacterium]|nr:endopeptidase La [bacterium]
KPRILIVDDEQITLENLKPILEKEGLSVVTANSGSMALEEINRSEFDVIITDLKMNNIDGIDVLEKVKSVSSDTQVIIMTGHATVETAVEAMRKGAFNYITKPFKAADVKSVIKDALQTKAISKSAKGAVLCFAGPPGTGKTSLGKAIADALSRKFGRIALGGIKDEAEIRGHRKTYAGALPGRIIEEIRKAGVMNPVIMLDELDKLGHDFQGDSASALLEVLDPEQNHEFIDHYLDVPFDLSKVMFIATANVADNIEAPLRDRMEIIEFSGYTEDEKVQIAINYLVPKHIRLKSLQDYPPFFNEDAISRIIHDYTREAGIRNLDRQIAAVCRKKAAQIVSGNISQTKDKITAGTIEKYLGPRKYYFEVADEEDRIGVTTGLVWKETGGAIIFVEAVKMKGSGELMITGSLGNIMNESAQAALSYIRSNAAAYGIDEDFFIAQDIHIHVPAGAIPKDGPSAGATIALSLISLLTKRAARRNVAISGELTLSGRTLPVGGLKDKLLAAKQAGVKSIVIPQKNKVDIDNLSENVIDGLNIHYISNISEAINYVLLESTLTA